ncbi:MAG: ubiquitin-conjugating enzyme E2 [Thermodesulfobacteriota bacterium]|nr:ubiquitin-conjugating enzyme E2 [Thermodesulfobacteriota bacterium]
MASDTDQLAVDFEKVQNTLELYPSINIIQVEGQPPESYEIEYLFKGYVRDVDGSIREGSQHRIRISLPFGYPHFPPTVKPLTAIFHPDIDPDAVRIADYWQQNPSLPDLILHIAEIICGNIYNLEDPFNQEAADWYAEHIDELPLDSLHIADIESADDTFDADDDTFDLLGLEDEEAAEAAEEAESVEQQLELIQLRIEQKEMVAANQLLAEIPESTPVPDRDEIEHIIAAALRESDKLFVTVERLEDKGKIDEALETVERITDIAADTPGLEDIRLRLQQAQIMAETFSDATLIPEVSSTSSQSESIPATGDRKRAKQPDIKLGMPTISFAGIPLKSILIAAPVLIVLVMGGITYFKDRNLLTRAESNWQQARNHLQKNQFQDAEKSARTALASLDKVRILRSKKKGLQAEITTLFTSTDFTKGLQGQIKYNDQYLPAKVIEKLQQLDKLSGNADKLIKEGKIRKAIATYDIALKFARKNELQAPAQSISQTINNLRFEDALASARKAESAKEWGNAAETYQRALEISKTLSDSEGTGEISKKLAAATVRHELDQSKEKFTDAQWQQTIEMLENTKKLLAENPDTISVEERWELDILLADSRLFQILSLARMAYENREWDRAITEYKRSLAMIRDEQDIFEGVHDGAVAKIEKTILMITISREQSLATASEQKNDMKTAISHYKAIEELLAAFGTSKDDDLLAIEENIRLQIKAKKDQLGMEKRINWLKENFEKIFNKAYPSSRSSKLSHPKVAYIKQTKGKQLFKMSCVERSQGSLFRLELKYQYNLANGKWSIYYD